jgi:predicted dehydrogenase/nucleoside-diphosphate-sugar epimerase
MKRFRVGLVGAGYICEYHIAALRRIPNVELVGVTDLDAARAEQIAKRFSIATFPSLDALREAGADCIHVLTPPHTHAAVALEALELGCHVLCEKPLATEVADCERIAALAAERGLQVCVNHSLLFDPQVRRALDAVRGGAIGRVVSVDILRSSVYPPYGGGPLPPQYRTAGYPFRDLGVHALYMFQAFLGPIEHVDASWASLGGDPNLAFDEWRAQVRCRDGLGQFQLSWNVKPLQSQIIIHGTRGVMRVDLFLMFQALRAVTPLPKSIERVLNGLTDSIQPLIDLPRGVIGYLSRKVLPFHGLQDLVAAFYQALDAGTPVPVSVAEATAIVDWTERIARAADQEHEERLARLPFSEHVPIVITGASGALGSVLVDRLVAQGKRMRLLMRRVPQTIPPNTEIVIGDLGDPRAVDRAIHGAEIVLHVGAATKGGWGAHECATVVGTKNVLEACRKHEVKKLVHISSLSVVDWAGSGARLGKREACAQSGLTSSSPSTERRAPSTALPAITEATPLEPRAEDRGAYTRAKLEAEELVTQYTKEHGLPTVILRPGQIFGGRIPLLTAAVARRVAGRWLVLGDGEVVLPLVHIEDVVDAILLAAESDLHRGEIIQIVDTVTPTQNELLARAVGKDARIVRVPRGIVFAAGKLSEVLLGLLKRKSPLSVYRLKSALAIRSFESANAGLLGWKPRLGVEEGIRRALEPAAERREPVVIGEDREPVAEGV